MFRFFRQITLNIVKITALTIQITPSKTARWENYIIVLIMVCSWFLPQ